jgi:hypothetical protein
MINYTTYMTRIQAKIGESKAPDGIKEPLWADIVIPELNSISKDVANELQKEGLSFRKSWGEQKLEEAPPTRLLGLVLLVIACLGWVTREKNDDTITWEKIQEMIGSGRHMSVTGSFK